MLRRARIDAAGALHHIICRGIQRCRIYRDDSDRQDFLSRLGRTLVETRTTCYAWALVPNHFHLLLHEFCGHGVILGKQQKDFQDVDKLLGMFGKRVAEARRNYRAYVEQGIEMGRRADLIGGKGTGNEWCAGSRLVGHRPAGSPAVGSSR